MRKIGEIELLREIGRGERASIWQAKRVALGGATKLVAVKLMSRDFEPDSVTRGSFRVEAVYATMLHYRTVVQVSDVGEDDGQFYLVMEWVDGMNLVQLLDALGPRVGTLSPELSAFVVGEVLHALAYAQTITHAGAPTGIAHGDLTPRAVLISASGEVKVTGFGTGLVGGAKRWRQQAPDQLRYKAPEQLRRGAREPAIDLYAVGAMLHELLDGRPFRGAIEDADLEGFVIEGVVPELQDPAAVPAELDTLRRALLQADPSRRVQSASEALELLMCWRGYKNESRELARLCAACMGVSAPRSGLHLHARVSEPEDEQDA